MPCLPYNLLILLLLCCLTVPVWTTTAPRTAAGMVLRVRLADGSMTKIHVPSGAEGTMTLHQILASSLSNDENDEDFQIRIGTSQHPSAPAKQISFVDQKSTTVSDLGLRHGSLLTLVRNIQNNQNKNNKSLSSTSSTTSKSSSSSSSFDPFPALAKQDYDTAVRRKQRRRGGMSYRDIAHIQSALHVVEPQPEGPLLRVYMCATSAEHFQAHCHSSTSTSPASSSKQSKPQQLLLLPRVGLLLGTIQRERVQTKPVKTRTSLSSLPSESDYCQVAKVHAVWEPTNQSSQDDHGCYDIDGLMQAFQQSTSEMDKRDSHSSISSSSSSSRDRNRKEDPVAKRVCKVASWLGLRPVGWIFSYTDPRLDKKDDSLPVYGTDVVHGARLQATFMQQLGRMDGAQCVTLAMDATTGATEAFQLSDVSVQMVAEDMLQVSSPATRMIPMKHEVLVDGHETTTLDSVLCLVNTALLSHKGSYASSHTLKKNGSLTKKSKKTLLKALEKDESSLFDALSDFNVLLALDQLLPETQSEELCRVVRKWVRGQRQGTQVGSELKVILQGLLST